MEKKAFVISTNILSPLGNTCDQNFIHLKKGNSGIRLNDIPEIWSEEFHASLFDKDIERDLDNRINTHSSQKYTKFEKLLIDSINTAIGDCSIEVKSDRTIFLISTTKGNIGLLENANNLDIERVSLHRSAKLVADYFGNPNKPLVISNACISGVLAIVTAKRLIQSGMYDYAIVVGADLITRFILSGFYSFQAISEEPCKPFDKSRNGITLGEAAGTIILSAFANSESDNIYISGGAITNDANHISGPSRTGEELSYSINKTLEEASVRSEDVDFISLHGTATIYNDEMEANAINLSNLQDVSANSMKGYFGHTLGAAGIIETIISIYSMKNSLILPTIGFNEYGLTKQINISQKLQNKALYNCLKTASGFGGCNASLLISKN